VISSAKVAVNLEWLCAEPSRGPLSRAEVSDVYQKFFDHWGYKGKRTYNKGKEM